MKFRAGANRLTEAAKINSVSCLHRGKNGRYAHVAVSTTPVGSRLDCFPDRYCWVRAWEGS